MSEEIKKTILIVEDDIISALNYARLLKEFGSDVITADTGEEGVRIATGSRRIDLILMDIDLGAGIDGTEAARQILARQTLPIVFLTCNSEREMLEKVRGITRYGYVIKNSSDVMLISTIEIALELFEANQKIMLDITERKQVEAELQWKTAFLEAQVNSSIDGILVVDKENRKTLQNQRLNELFHIPQAIVDDKDDWIQRRWVAQQIKDPVQFMDKILYLNSHPTEISRDELEFTDGLILDRYSSPMTGGDGKYYGRIWTFRDITQNKRAEEEIQRNAMRLRKLVDILQYRSGNTQNFLDYALEQAIELTGSKIGYMYHYFEDREEFIFDAWSKGVMDECATENRKIVHKLEKTGMWGETVRQRRPIIVNDFQADNPLKKGYPEGHRHLKNFISVPIFKDDRIVGVVGFANKETDYDSTDILQISLLMEVVWKVSEAKETEEALKENLIRYHAMIEQSNDGISIANLDGRYIMVNPAYCKMTGYSHEELLTMRVTDLLHRETPLKLFPLVAKECQSGGREVELVRKDGSTFLSFITGTSLKIGDTRYVQGFVQDITERKQAEKNLKEIEERLRQSEKMEAIGQLAGGIAHDFNNILGIILGYATMFEERRIDPEKYDDCIAVIIKNVERGAALVQQILTFARKTDVLVEPLNIPGFIREIVKMLEQTFPKTVVFSLSVTPELPNILGDRTQIHQVLLNLCVNARDAMPNGGSIDITAGLQTRNEIQARFPAASEEAYLCITVSDTGEGMDEATRLRVFEPFFTTKEQGKGTGLGLSVVYGIMQNHNGFVGVESRKGHGTRFSLFLPAAKRRALAQHPNEQQLSDIRGGTETVLVVEDEEFLVKIVSMCLEGKGYRFIVAKDGQEAVELFEQHQEAIDVVLTDIGLPRMNGFDEFKRLREIDPHIKVILASGYYDPPMKEELQRSGANGFINKPYKPVDVLRTIRQVLDSK